MATVRASLTDNSVKDNVDPTINGSEVDANPYFIADWIDGTITQVGINQVGNAYFTILPWTLDERIGRVRVYNNTAATFSDGDLLYVSSYNTSQNLFEVKQAIATASSTTTLYAKLVADGAIPPTSAGNAVKSGKLASVDTSGLTVGRPIFLGITAAQWTGTLPGAPVRIQVVGTVVTVSTSGYIRFDLPGTLVPYSVADQI